MYNILVLCTGNSSRSQMAEGYIRHFAKDRVNVYSAGTEIREIHPFTVEVMREDNIDISGQTSNHVDEYRHIDFDYIITVCDDVKEKVSSFPSKAVKYHQHFPDPAKSKGSDEEIMKQFRKVRNMIKKYAQEFVNEYVLHLVQK